MLRATEPKRKKRAVNLFPVAKLNLTMIWFQCSLYLLSFPKTHTLPQLLGTEEGKHCFGSAFSVTQTLGDRCNVSRVTWNEDHREWFLLVETTEAYNVFAFHHRTECKYTICKTDVVLLLARIWIFQYHMRSSRSKNDRSISEWFFLQRFFLPYYTVPKLVQMIGCV